MQRELPPMSRSWILAGAQKDSSSRRAAPRKWEGELLVNGGRMAGLPDCVPQLLGGGRQLEGNVRHRGILPGLVNALERSGAGCASIRAGSRQDLVFTGKTVALPPTRVAHGE